MLSYRKLAMRVLGRPLHTGGGIDSPRPASQRAAAFILTAAMLTTLAAPAFADTWCIENGNITVKAGDTKGTNKVSQGSIIDKVDTNTVITNNNKNTASSNTVTIEAKDKDDKVEVKLDNVNIDTSKQNKAAVSVTGKDGQRTSYTSIRGNNILSLRVGRFTASFRISLSTLRQLRAEGIDTITFQTILCSTTLSVDELLAMGGEDTPVALAHSMGTARLTVGGEDHSELLK